jgi:hypothetical protein
MKTVKVMKNLKILMVMLLIAAVAPAVLYGQEKEKEKELKLKVVKEKDGERTVLDTTLNINIEEMISGEDLQEVMKVLEELGLEDIDVEIGNLDKMLEDMEVEVKAIELEEGGQEKVVVLKKMAGSGDSEETVHVTVMHTDSLVDSKFMKMTVGEDSYSYVISGDDEHDVKIGNGEHKVLMFMDEDGKKTEIIVGGDDLEWTSSKQNKVEVIEDESGKRVIVENEDGTRQEYDLPDEKGTYVIGEDGEIRKIDDDVVWVDENEDVKRITVHVDDDNQALIIQETDGSVQLKNVKTDYNVIVRSGNMDEGEHDVFVEVIEKKEGDKTVRLKSKIIVKQVGEEDVKDLEKKGVDLEPEKGANLEIERMTFHPNPSDGKFTLEFTTKSEGAALVSIYDVNGKKVYEENIDPFDGHYKNEIDISTEKKGIYFLKISQGDKMSSRKIILE